MKDPEAIPPPHLVADEKHTWWWGERVYVAVTAAIGCFLGGGLAESADVEALTQAYGEFRKTWQRPSTVRCPDVLGCAARNLFFVDTQEIFCRGSP